MEPKRKKTALLLCLIGITGAHRFYLLGVRPTAFMLAALTGFWALTQLRPWWRANDVGAIGLAALMLALLWTIIDAVRIATGLLKAPAESGPVPPADVLKVMAKQGGSITPAMVAVHTGINPDEAKRALDSLVNGGHVELRVSPSGAVHYVLPEMLEPERRDGPDQ